MSREFGFYGGHCKRSEKEFRLDVCKTRLEMRREPNLKLHEHQKSYLAAVNLTDFTVAELYSF